MSIINYSQAAKIDPLDASIFFERAVIYEKTGI